MSSCKEGMGLGMERGMVWGMGYGYGAGEKLVTIKLV